MKSIALTLLLLFSCSLCMNAQVSGKEQERPVVKVLEKRVDVEKCLLKLNGKFYIVSTDEVSQFDSKQVESIFLLTPGMPKFSELVKESGIKPEEIVCVVVIDLTKGTKVPDKYKD